MSVSISVTGLIVLIVIQFVLSMHKNKHLGIILPLFTVLYGVLVVVTKNMDNVFVNLLKKTYVHNGIIETMISCAIYILIEIVIYVVIKKIKNRKKKAVYVGIKSSKNAKIDPDELLSPYSDENDNEG